MGAHMESDAASSVLQFVSQRRQRKAEFARLSQTQPSPEPGPLAGFANVRSQLDGISPAAALEVEKATHHVHAQTLSKPLRDIFDTDAESIDETHTEEVTNNGRGQTARAALSVSEKQGHAQESLDVTHGSSNNTGAESFMAKPNRLSIGGATATTSSNGEIQHVADSQPILTNTLSMNDGLGHVRHAGMQSHSIPNWASKRAIKKSRSSIARTHRTGQPAAHEHACTSISKVRHPSDAAISLSASRILPEGILSGSQVDNVSRSDQPRHRFGFSEKSEHPSQQGTPRSNGHLSKATSEIAIIKHNHEPSEQELRCLQSDIEPNTTDDEETEAHLESLSTRISNAKRPRSLDYSLADLQSMDYQYLKDQPFDNDPRSPDHSLPAELAGSITDDTMEYLFAARNQSSAREQRRVFFNSLKIEDHEECGDLIIEQFHHVLERLKRLRREKRLVCQEYETSVAKRQRLVSDKRVAIESDLKAMQIRGKDIVPKKRECLV